MPSFQLFILCHNRVEMASNAIYSALDQLDNDFKLIISDNSTNDDVYNLCINNFPQLTYKRRKLKNNLDHLKCCIKEADSDYFCIFHDDDILLKNFIQKSKAVASLNPGLIAFGFNSLLSINGNDARNFFFNHYKEIIIIGEMGKLINHYFGFLNFGYPAFPGYVYKKDVQVLTYPNKSGKYSDFQWLAMLVSIGNIGWINTPTFIYNLHSLNDSCFESIRDRFKTLAFIKKNKNLFATFDLNIYRLFIYKRLLLNGKNFNSYLFKKIIFSLNLKIYLNYNFYLLLLNFIQIKICNKFNKIFKHKNYAYFFK